ncbi:uncharacterized protein PFL1_03044 [Pseudozyma flocculosa PF-1]|uniref:Uncharacterized protein n=1 Tax=Pseudozyma flocculosa PF-1 TaxID=1277687 RepID=A0A061H9Z6_9BASI|nr:uncharacterized protein PFL1_03044 [Pseudozyma flocculosa PF-1]EPQ29289.1 hypothetical protein PFL1_03044 [Pseudozyma flocculosa PF-1]
MFHSRGFAPHENQPFAAQARTPGPSRSHLSPTRSRAMTTGKRGLGEMSSKPPFGQDSSTLGPKQLFKELASKTPARALGDRTNKTPGLRNRQGQNEDSSPAKKDMSSPSKGKAKTALQSPSKGSQSVSPKKAVGQPLRTLNGKMKENAATPFSRADQSYATDMSSMMTPAPNAPLLKGRMMSRQTSFVTPAANIGKAGQIKARMGEMLDAELGLNLDDLEAPQLETHQSQRELTEEELYPEIEYMPPSTWATNPPYEYPSELDGVPSAKELAQQLATFRPAGFLKGVPAELSDSEDAKAFPELTGDALDLGSPPQLSDGGASDDDLWPDVPISASSAEAGSARPSDRLTKVSARPTEPRKASSLQVKSRTPATATSARAGATSASTIRPRSQPSSASSSTTLSRPSTSASKASAASTSTRLGAAPPGAKAASGPAGRGAPPAGSTRPGPSRPSNRIAQTPTSARPASSSSAGTTQSRKTSLMRSIAPPRLATAGRPATGARPTARPPPPSAARGAVPAPPKPRMQMNVKLRDLRNDDLGRFVEEKMQQSTAETSFEGFDLEPVIEASDEPCAATSSAEPAPEALALPAGQDAEETAPEPVSVSSHSAAEPAVEGPGSPQPSLS